MPTLQENDSGPKYRQVLDTLRGEILSGQHLPGAKLPSEIDLVKRFGASRITIGRAVKELRDLGLIERRAGSGTYVREIRLSGLTFGLLIPNLGDSDILQPICSGMADTGGEHALLWGKAPEEATAGERALTLCKQYVERRVSGVFFAPLEFTDEDEAVNRRIVAMLEKERIPIVLLDRCYLPYPGRSRHDLVGIDNRRAGHLATEHLLNLGCRRLAFLSHLHAASTVGARIAGHGEALFRHGVDFDSDLLGNFDTSDLGKVREFVQTHKPEGIVCSNDRVAANVMRALLDTGMRVPEDMRIVGIDDMSYASLLPVPLTTVHQPSREIGMAAMETMISRLDRPKMPTRDVLLATRLVVRKSCGAAL